MRTPYQVRWSISWLWFWVTVPTIGVYVILYWPVHLLLGRERTEPMARWLDSTTLTWETLDRWVIAYKVENGRMT